VWWQPYIDYDYLYRGGKIGTRALTAELIESLPVGVKRGLVFQFRYVEHKHDERDNIMLFARVEEFVNVLLNLLSTVSKITVSVWR
jgi:hypothetical protein